MAKGRSSDDIIINGNPNNLRSYLYPTDAILQLLSQCQVAEPLHSQVGSFTPTTILNVARNIANLYAVQLRIAPEHELKTDNYVPQDVPEYAEISFEKGLERWKKWIDSTSLS